MIRGFITYQDKLNELRLDLSHPNNRGIAYVLVEGDTDIRLFRKTFDLTKCRVEAVPGGNVKLEECVATLSDKHKLVIGIRDADFLHLEEAPYEKNNMFLTDFHDMEMSLIYEDDILSSLLFENTDMPPSEHSNIRLSIFQIIENVSYLRLINYKHNAEFSFEVGFQDLLSFQTNSLDLAKFFQRILAKSENARFLNLDDLLEMIDTEKQKGNDYYQVTNGHDFFKALSAYINQSGEALISGDKVLCITSRVTYSLAHFKKTNLYKNVRQWGESVGCEICLV
ncbi:DUF4435 domain-containing protein [Dyadobacter psychrophilus]|uniref:Uncharacterized protein n=1 Tax=Dyadobacter psychrophilus TaxID=651661 RepID=A0A1T5ETU5_9BACT|nr:DUF4435 domain-containing protein [Dyadobacter psychrophilus]SKB87219.1 Protein of unknown function [Dyadobacter psychrophilus]